MIVSTAAAESPAVTIFAPLVPSHGESSSWSLRAAIAPAVKAVRAAPR